MKFSIRDLFLATMIVALAVGWWVDRAKLGSKVDELQKKLEGRQPPTVEDVFKALRGKEHYKKMADESREKYGVP